MFTSVVAAVVALNAPAAEAGTLTLSNVRATYGVLGPVRADNKVLPGDSYVICFDIDGITIGPDGKVAYSVATEVRNAAGRVQFKQEPKPVEAPTSLGGREVPANARLDIGLETPPGVLTFQVTVTDRAAGISKTLTREVEVLPKDFGLVRLSVTNDPDGLLPAAALGVGQSAWLQLGAIGFVRSAGSQSPAVSFTFRIMDQSGKPTQQKPIHIPAAKDLPLGMTLIPVQFLLSLNRPGKFTAEITATDEESKKTARLSVPLTVVESK